MKLPLSTNPNVHKRVLDFSTGFCQILACTKVKVRAQHKSGRCEEREKMLEIIAEKENLGAAVSITEPGKDADGV